MFRTLLCPSSGVCDCDVDYHIRRIVLGLLCVGGYVRFGLNSIRAAECSLDTTQTEPQAAAWILLKLNRRLQPGYYSN